MVGSLALALAVVAAGASGGARASAAERAAPDTTVRLKSGAVYRGVLVENVPGDHVTIQLADGEIKKFAAGAVAAVRTLEAPAQVASPEALSADEAMAAAPKLAVDLSSTHPDARLFQIAVVGPPGAGGRMTATNQEVCAPPCARELPAGSYKIVGKDLEPSRVFDLVTSSRRVRISTEPASATGKTTGTALLIGSGVLGTVGLPALFYGGFIYLATSDSNAFGTDRGTWKTVAEVGAVLSTAALVAGVAGLIYYMQETKVSVSPAPM